MLTVRELRTRLHAMPDQDAIVLAPFGNEFDVENVANDIRVMRCDLGNDTETIVRIFDIADNPPLTVREMRRALFLLDEQDATVTMALNHDEDSFDKDFVRAVYADSVILPEVMQLDVVWLSNTSDDPESPKYSEYRDYER